jgi:hypothetical protein
MGIDIDIDMDGHILGHGHGYEQSRTDFVNVGMLYSVNPVPE